MKLSITQVSQSPGRQPSQLQQELDSLFGAGRAEQLACFHIDDDDAAGAEEFTWDADSATTIEFPEDARSAVGAAATADGTSRRLLRRTSSTVSSKTPSLFQYMAPLAIEVGDASNGSVLPDVKGICTEIGSETLVRMAMRCILMLPNEQAIRVCNKYKGVGSERVSTTFSCSDGVMEAKCAIVVAAKMLLGEMQMQFDCCRYIIDQVVAAEIEQFKVDFLKQKTRAPFHRLQLITKDRCISFVVAAGKHVLKQAVFV